MDSQRPLEQGSRASSAETAQIPADRGEHVDSPLRKRPRLNHSPTTDAAMAAKYTPPPPTQPSTTSTMSPPSTPLQLTESALNNRNGPMLVKTPSRVTLNLRASRRDSPHSSSDPDAEPVSEVSSADRVIFDTDRDGPTREFLLDQDSIDITSDSPLSGSQSPPVVEIEVDDSEDIENETYPVLETSNLEARWLDKFPHAFDHGAIQSVNMLVDAMSTAGTIEIDLLTQLSTWAEAWLKHAKSSRARCNRSYVNNQEFWTPVALLYSKFVAKKTPFGRFQASSDTSRAQIMSRFLCVYLELAAEFVHLDVENLRRASTDSDSPPRWFSIRHLKNIEFLFKYWDNVPIWQLLRHNYHLNASQLQQALADTMLLENARLLSGLGELIRITAKTVRIWPTLAPCIEALGRTVSNVMDFVQDSVQSFNEAELPQPYRTFREDIMACIENMKEQILHDVGKESSVLPTEVSETMAKVATQLLKAISLVEPTMAASRLIDGFEDFKDLGPLDVPRSLGDRLFLTLAWAFVSKGRMELRVRGAIMMSAYLVTLWSDYNLSKPANGCHPLWWATASWLIREKILEYILSVDSHPQIINRSRDILGFLLVTGCWTRQTTDMLWTTIVTLQDRRIVAAALDITAQSLNLARLDQYLDFSKKINELPLTAFGPEMRSFVCKLIDEFPTIIVSDRSDACVYPDDLCVRLLQQASRHRLLSGLNSDVESLHSLASEMLKRISHKPSDLTARKRLYSGCVDEILAQSEKALGSVDAIHALVSVQRPMDAHLLTADFNLLETLARELSISRNPALTPLTDEVRPYSGTMSYLRLFALLVTHAPSVSLPEALEHDLWSHLIGKDAWDDESREIAWTCLRDVVLRIGSRPNAIIGRLIDKHLVTLSPGLFNAGFYQFVEASIQHMHLIGPPSPPAENRVVPVPLSGILWRLILESNDDFIQTSSIALLSQQYLDVAAISRAPRSSIAATHTILIDQCITQLKEAASGFTRQSIDLTESNGHREVSTVKPSGDVLSLAENNEVRFVRTLRFMERFLADIKARPAFCEPVTQLRTPSPDTPSSASLGNTVTLKYQPFSIGKQERIKELFISESASVADLYERLKRITGFEKISIINSGKTLDAATAANVSAKSLSEKGLLIVRNMDERVPPLHSAVSSSAAEKAVVTQFDILYNFLDLEEILGSPVYQLLSGFPPHGRVRLAVFEDIPPLKELFPCGRRVRTLYSIRSLNHCLNSQTASGMVEEKFVAFAVRLLTAALTDSDFGASYLESSIDQVIACNLVECLYAFLKERPLRYSLDLFIVNNKTLADRLYKLMQRANDQPASLICQRSWVFYAALVETSFHSRPMWEIFIAREDTPELHYKLLTCQGTESGRYHIRNCIEHACKSDSSPSGVKLDEYAQFYWHLLAAMIPKMADSPEQSKQVLATAVTLFSDHAAQKSDELMLQSNITTWTALMSAHTHMEIPGKCRVDEFLLGLTRLLTVGVTFLRSFKKPIRNLKLVKIILTKFLFPPLSNTSAIPSSLAHSVPALDDDVRRELYSLALSLSEDPDSYSWLVDQVSQLLNQEAQHDPAFWNSDRSYWLRGSAGYSGLRNLTNTCYMNSLLAQLFMNSNFREFMLQVQRSDKQSPQELLAATQVLFAQMQDGIHKFADTSRFASAVQPYDSDHIDVTVQMDVDEFYNLLFDRWEGQLLSPEARREFRSIYGGQLVTQIKSMDCEHVSERLEPFLAIQCEVKGKSSLDESLRAYVEGDTMEGDNKYKCESCGGRLVNAVKRSCLKDIPDNLIFHLKRFDFDLATLQRSKINDHFTFPETIDMNTYHIDYISGQSIKRDEDIFELVGILVHNGTAETGHYYSYIRLQQTANGGHFWGEFNDTEVTDFDPSKIPDQCFGGVWEQPGTDLQFPKSNSAYMLFYRRVTDSRIQFITDGPDYGSLMRTPIARDMAEEISTTNEQLLRRYCMFGSDHANFVKSLVSSLTHINGAICSDDHRMEQAVISVVMGHLWVVRSRAKDVPDFEMLTSLVKRFTSACGTCASLVLHWIESNPRATYDLLLHCPIAKVRAAWAKLVADSLQDLRRHDPQLYGVDLSEINVEPLDWNGRSGHFQEIIKLMLNLFPNIGKHFRVWDEYFGLWMSVAVLGLPELGMLLNEHVFQDCIELLLFDRKFMAVLSSVLQSDRNIENVHILARVKRVPPKTGLLQLVLHFLLHLDPFGPAAISRRDRLESYDPISKRFPMLDIEKRGLLCWDKQSRQMPFVVKTLEAMEELGNIDTPWYPGEVIAYLLDAGAPPTMVSRIGYSISSSLGEWRPEHSGFILRSALFFCRSCTTVEAAEALIIAAASHAQTMAAEAESKRNTLGSEYPPHNGQVFISFFEELAWMMNAVCPPLHAVDSPYMFIVIAQSHVWGPALLLFDERVVRENAWKLLDALIFHHYPEDLEGSEPTDLDRVRCEAVRRIFQGCLNTLTQTEHHHMPHSAVRESLMAMERCTLWLSKLQRDPNGEALQHEQDGAIIIRFQEVKRRGVDVWHDESAETMFSETEWASQFDDEEESSDETEGNS